MKDFRIYRPYKENQGAASKIQVVEKIREKGDRKYAEVMIFWEAAPQLSIDENSNATFDWASQENKEGKSITMKLGMVDLGEILAVLNGRKDFVGTKKDQGLFHKTDESHNKGFQFYLDDQGRGYYFRMSEKGPSGLKQVRHGLSFSDGELLKVVLSEAVRLYYA